MDDGVLKDQALTLWMKGQKHHLRGDFNRAIELYMNLGRIYAQKGMVLRAIQEFEAALEIHAGEPTCLSALGQLRGALN
jgi:tetratricopeptide (TPR) repeat protein